MIKIITNSYPNYSIKILFVLLLALTFLKVLAIYVILPWAVDIGLAPNSSHRFFDQYVMIAENLINQRGYRVDADFALTMERNPGYVFLLYALMFLFGNNLISIQIVNLMLTFATAVLVFFLTKKVTRNIKCSYVALIVVYLHPSIMFLETRGGVEVFFMFLFAASLSLLYRAIESDLLRNFFLAGLVFGFCLLVRTSPLPMVLLLFLYLLLIDRNQFRIRYATIRILIFSLGFLLVLSPWVIRNYQAAKVLTFNENMLGMSVFLGYYATKSMDQDKDYQIRILDGMSDQGRIAASYGLVFDDPEDSEWDRFYTLDDEIKYNTILLSHTINQYIEKPFLFIKHCMLNIVRFWFQGATPKVTFVNAVITIPLLALSIYGTIIGYKSQLRIIPLWMAVFSVYLVHIPLIAQIRFYIPLIPFLAILFSIGFVELYDLYSLKRTKPISQSLG